MLDYLQRNCGFEIKLGRPRKEGKPGRHPFYITKPVLQIDNYDMNTHFNYGQKINEQFFKDLKNQTIFNAESFSGFVPY